MIAWAPLGAAALLMNSTDAAASALLFAPDTGRASPDAMQSDDTAPRAHAGLTLTSAGKGMNAHEPAAAVATKTGRSMTRGVDEQATPL